MIGKERTAVKRNFSSLSAKSGRQLSPRILLSQESSGGLRRENLSDALRRIRQTEREVRRVLDAC